ncbi:MAG: VOC family protein [Thermomicrobiales bacterium]
MTSTTNKFSLPDRAGLKAPFAALHHVALVTNDMKATVDFYRDVHRQRDRDGSPPG